MPKASNLRGLCAPYRAWAGLLTAFSLLLSIVVGLGTATQAQAFSNSGAFIFGTSKVIVEDVAICTKFDYNFDSGLSEWAITGYQTCASETLTADSPPATLQFKLRIQTSNPNEFLASTASAYIVNTSGNRIATPRWAATPLVNVDGNFNLQDGVFYGAFAIRDKKTFSPGTYSLVLEYTNALWSKLNGATTEIPISINIFTFTINQGKSGAESNTNTPSGTLSNCTVDPSFSAAVQSSTVRMQTLMSKAKGYSDPTTPGIAQGLDDYAILAKKEIEALTNVRAKFESLYGANIECTEVSKVRKELTAVMNQAVGTLEFIETSNAVAKRNVKQKVSPADAAALCEKQGTAALVSIRSSRAVFAAYKEKSTAKFDVNAPNAMQILTEWQTALDIEFKNLLQWGAEVGEYQNIDPDCQDYATASDWIAKGKYEYRQVSSIIGEMKSKVGVIVENNTTKSVGFAEDDGTEEEPAAKLDVSYSAPLGRFIMKVEGNLPEVTLVVRATKKGAKALRFTIETDEDGVGGLRTKTKLSGYTLTLLYGTTKLDTFRVK